MSLDRLELVDNALIDALVHMLSALHGLLLEPHANSPQLSSQYPILYTLCQMPVGVTVLCP